MAHLLPHFQNSRRKMTRTAKAVKPKPKIYKPATRKEAQARQLERLEGRTEGLKKDMKTQTRGKKQVMVR